MEVSNIGNVSTKNIRVTDYIPEGFVVSAASLASGWSMNGDMARFTIPQSVAPGQKRKIQIELLDLGTSNVLNITNRAEISRLENAGGLDWSNYDFDSNPDEIFNNDLPNEDDIDTAPVPVFDLALSKKIPNKGLVYKVGDEITFAIRVLNQGNLPSYQTRIVDYLNSDFEFSPGKNPDWTLQPNGYLSYDILNPILAGEDVTVNLVLSIKEGKAGIIIPNFAEISDAIDENGASLLDYDSTPDDLNDNDKFVENSDLTDHGEIDEDDHDGTDTNPNNFDLTLSKSVDVRSIQRGQEVDWTMTITNEGSSVASEIVIVDQIPEGTSLVSTQDWLQSTTNPNPRKFYYTLSEKMVELLRVG